MQPLPLSKTVEKVKWPQHFTRLNHTDYISHELTSHLLLKKWLADNKKFLLETPPLQPVAQ